MRHTVIVLRHFPEIKAIPDVNFFKVFQQISQYQAVFCSYQGDFMGSFKIKVASGVIIYWPEATCES